MRLSEITSIPVFDAHVHIFPDKLYKAIRTWFDANAWNFHLAGPVESLLESYLEREVSEVLLLPYSHKPGVSEELNFFTRSLVNRYRGVSGLAAIHPYDDNPEEILEKAFDDYGLKGVKLHTHVMCIPPDDESMFPIYETVIRKNGVVLNHAGKEPSIDAYGMDVRSISGAERVENVLKRYPEMKMIIPHLGMNESDVFFRMLDAYPNLYLDTTMVVGGFFDVDMEPEKLEAYSDRILYGTDYPHIPYEVETEVKALVNMGLSEQCLRRILYENAAALLGCNSDS